MSEEMCVDAAIDKKDSMSRKMDQIEDPIELCDERKASDKDLDERGLLKKCNKINNSYRFVTDESVFVKEFSDKQEDLKHKSCCYRPKLVLIDNRKTGQQRLAFVINVVKQEGKKDTINDIDIHSICTKYYTLSDDFNLDVSSAVRRETLIGRLKNRHNVISTDEEDKYIEKEEIKEKQQQFKLGKTSLSFDSYGVNYSTLDEDLIKLIYSEMKPKFREMVFSFKDYMDNNDKFIAVLYSGGKDSTCRVLELLNKGYNVLPLVNTFNSHNATDLLIRDIAITYNLYHIFKNGSFKGKLYRPRFISYTSFHFDYDYMGLNQQPYNIVSLALLGKEFYKRCTRIEMCLIGGDIGVSFIPEMKRLYNDVLKFNCNCCNDSVKSLPPLTFPYIKLTKTEIINSLNSQLSENDRFKEYFIPTCQEITIRNINLQYRGDRAYLVIRFCFCGQCVYCRNYLPKSDEDGIDIAIPLKEISSVDTQNIVSHSENIYKISERLANLYSAF